MKNNKVEVYGRILYNQLINDSCECQESFCVINLIEETKKISVFLQDRFKDSKLTNEYIFYIFEEISKRLENLKGEKELYYNKKIIYILLNYIKDNFFSINIDIGKQLFSKYISNPSIKYHVTDYLRELNYSIQKSSIKPYMDIAFSLCVQGIPEDYNLINDIRVNNFEGIKKFLDSKTKYINSKINPNLIDELCILFETLNQLGIVLNIGGEQRKIGIKFYKNILIKGIQDAIKTYLVGIKNNQINKILKNNNDIIYSKVLEKELSKNELKDIKKLQNIYGKFLCCYEGTINYNQILSKTGNIENITNEMGELTKRAQSKIVYGHKLRSNSFLGDEQESYIKKMKREFAVTSQLSTIYLNLKRIKQTIRISEFNYGNSKNVDSNDSIVKLNKERFGYSKLIIDLYKIINNKASKISSSDDLVMDFIRLDKPSYNQLVILYNLVISGTVSIGTLQTLIKKLINTKGIRSISYQKYKLQTIEAIIGELGNRTVLCEHDCENFINCRNEKRNEIICRDIIGLIENYINSLKNTIKHEGHYFVFNYGKLYLSLSYLFSFWGKEELIQKAKEYLTIFQEKYSYVLNNYGNEQYKYIDYEKIETENKITQIINNIKICEEKKYTIENSINEHIHTDTLERRSKIEKALFDTILKIQKQKGEYSRDTSDSIKTRICELISNSLFDGLCEINIIKKGKKITIGKFEKVEIIEGELSDIDIIFKYNSIYEENFKHLFKKEKDFIKEKLMLFIVSNDDYLTISEDFKTMIGFIGKLMEAKDTYTKGHIKRVADFSYVVGKILGWSIPDLSRLAINAMIHDIGKVNTPDSILKKTGSLTKEEKIIMDMHTGNGIYEGIKIGINKKYLEGMPHHTKFYSEKSNETLKFKDLIKYIEQGLKIDIGEFNRLAGNNIPYIARIIMIGDVIDAIASRRIYDNKRATMKIEDILKIIDQELLKCSGLIRDKLGGKIIVDKNTWKEIKEDEEKNNVYKININGKYYIPTKKTEITFDASIVFLLLNDKEAYNKIKNQIINSDKENVNQKIIEIDRNIKYLKEKNIEYKKVLKEIKFFGARNISDYFEREGKKIEKRDVSGLVSSILKDGELLLLIEKSNQLKIAFTPDNQDELIRLSNLQKRMMALAKHYQKTLKG